MNALSFSAVAVLDRAPKDEREARLCAESIAFPDAPTFWFVALTLPPLDLPEYERDQLTAHLRDNPDAVYLVVL